MQAAGHRGSTCWAPNPSFCTHAVTLEPRDPGQEAGPGLASASAWTWPGGAWLSLSFSWDLDWAVRRPVRDPEDPLQLGFSLPPVTPQQVWLQLASSRPLCSREGLTAAPCSWQPWNSTVRPRSIQSNSQARNSGVAGKSPFSVISLGAFPAQCPLSVCSSGPSCCWGPGPLDQWGAADVMSLTFLDKEALMRQPQGVRIHLDLDRRLLVLVRLEQPEGLVHEQVLQAVMSEA